jgi:Putative peptidoglycan binding domain
MKSSKISTLAAGGVLLLAAGLLSGCGEEPEDAVNQSEGMAIAPMPSEETAGEPIATLEDSEDFGLEGMEGLEGMDTIDGIDTTDELNETESIDDLFESISETTDEAADATAETMTEFAETTSDVFEESIEVTRDDVVEEEQTGDQTTASSTYEETQETLMVEETNVVEETAMVEDKAIEVVTVTPEIIRGVQQALLDAGFNPGPVDGISGPRTLAALESFQKQNNIAAGQFTKETLRALGVDY